MLQLIIQESSTHGHPLRCRGRSRLYLWLLLLQGDKRHLGLPVGVHISPPFVCVELRATDCRSNTAYITRNRLGLFLFILSLFGFSCLSSLGIFSSERMLFMRER